MARRLRCLAIIEKAINDAGGRREHVIRTRIYLKEMTNWQDAGRAHGEFFKDIRPASTMIQIVQAIDPAWLVEIEADAIVTVIDSRRRLGERSQPAFATCCSRMKM